MPFLNYILITNPPNDELVDEEVQLNSNWRESDTKMAALQGALPFPSGTVLEAGQQAIINNRLAVYTGDAWSNPKSFWNTWGTWQLIAPVAPYVIRPGFPLKYRINALLRKIELTGGLINTASASPWPNTYQKVSADTGGIPEGYKPVRGLTVQQTAAQGLTGTTASDVVSTAICRVTTNAALSLRIEIKFCGQAGTGTNNFVMLDGVKWWY